jgi:outer membrane lipoprotein-sorting protein
MKLPSRLLLAAFAWLLTGAEAGAFSASYDQEIVAQGQTIHSKVLIKDEQFRMEFEMRGMPAMIVRNATGVYQYLPNERVAMRLPSAMVPQNPLQDARGYVAANNLDQLKPIRSETVNGYPCEVYQFPDPTTKGTTTAWIWEAQHFPVKIEQQTQQGLVTAVLSNIRVGALIADSAFQLPDGVEVMDMGGAGMMPQGVGDDVGSMLPSPTGSWDPPVHQPARRGAAPSEDAGGVSGLDPKLLEQLLGGNQSQN